MTETLDKVLLDVIKGVVYESHEPHVDYDEEMASEETARQRSGDDSGSRSMLPMLLVGLGFAAVGYTMGKRSSSGGGIASETSKRIQGVTDKAADRTEEMAGSTADRVREGGQSMSERTETTAGAASERIEETSEELGDQIEEDGSGAADRMEDGD